MLDDFLTDIARPWTRKLGIGDIVLCRFPLVDPGDGHARKPRPCIVADIEIIEDVVFAELMPGTQSDLPEPAVADIQVDASAFCGDLAEGAPWRFVAQRSLKVDTAHGSFVTPDDSTSPVVGRLHGFALEKLEALRQARRASREQHLAKRRARRPDRRPRKRAR